VLVSSVALAEPQRSPSFSGPDTAKEKPQQGGVIAVGLAGAMKAAS
jgi:co-chaperonin GroES (HSP10)